MASMGKVVIYGASGYTGGNIARELVARGHQVVGVARDASKISIDGVQAVAGNITDLALLAILASDADVVLSAVHHGRGFEGERGFASYIADIAKVVANAGARLGVVGGAGSLQVSEDGPCVYDTPDFPPQFQTEARGAFATLEALRKVNAGDWFYVSPAGGYGSYAPGERLGTYRTAFEVLVTDEVGKSFISGEDFAIAMADEIETLRHQNIRFTVGY